jgi:predicted DNA-binding protein
MAKLSPKDPQFGIPVASRMNKETAFQMNKEAERTGKTLSRYLSEYIEKAKVFEKKIKELTEQLTREKEISGAKEKRIAELQSKLDYEKELIKRVTGKFILEISEGKQKQATQFITTYNKILKHERDN